MTHTRTAWRVVILSPLRLLVESLGSELRRAGFADVLDAVPRDGGIRQGAGGQRDLLFLYDGSTGARLHALAAETVVQQLSLTVVFGLVDPAHDVALCARLGVPGILRHDASVEQLLAALDTVSLGGVFLMPPVPDIALRGPRHATPGSPGGTLTQREYEVALLVARGLSNKKIAGALRAGEGTVKNHVRNVIAKLGVGNRAGVGSVLGALPGGPSVQAARHAAGDGDAKE